jgi:hypothetical protein
MIFRGTRRSLLHSQFIDTREFYVLFWRVQCSNLDRVLFQFHLLFQFAANSNRSSGRHAALWCGSSCEIDLKLCFIRQKKYYASDFPFIRLKVGMASNCYGNFDPQSKQPFLTIWRSWSTRTSPDQHRLKLHTASFKNKYRPWDWFEPTGVYCLLFPEIKKL